MNRKNRTYSGHLRLADDSSWDIAAEDSCGADIGRYLSEIMQLGPVSQNARELLTLKNQLLLKGPIQGTPFKFKSFGSDNRTTCQLFPTDNNDILAMQLMKLSLIFSSQSEKRGGLLVHGALAERNGKGVILAGPGEVGKTTASKRLPLPWKSLCDDCTLIVMDKNDRYQAHPWPTWSSFMFGNTGGSWDVQYSIPLKAIFFLNKDDNDRVKPIGQGEAACLLSEASKQAQPELSTDLKNRHKRALNLQRFDTICHIVKRVPAFLLQFSRTGKFWKEIEQVL